jgi:hypothetical protein
MIPFIRVDDLWEFHLGRFSIHQRLFPCLYEKRFEIVEAPGRWYFEIGHWRVSWQRKWIVWGDHPYRGENIRFHDQSGMFGKRALS